MTSIDDYIISPQTTVVQAMQKIDAGSRGIAYICQDDVLQAAVTDGDIRRFILQKGDLNAPIAFIANKNVKFLVDVSAVYAITFMKNNNVDSIPIVNAQNKIKTIVFLDGEQVFRKATLNTPVVIMAGGKGTRLLPYTQVLPKPLIPIGEKTITEHIMDRFKAFGCTDFHLIVNYKRNLMKAYFQDDRYDQSISFIDETEFLGTGGGLSLLSGQFKDTFFMTNCDVLIEDDYADILQHHKKHNNMLTMVCATKNINIPYGTVDVDSDGCIVAMQEKPVIAMKTNTGFYVIEPKFLEFIPQNTFIHITDVIQSCIKKKIKIGVYSINEHAWLDMGEFDELDIMRSRLEDGSLL